MLIQAPQLCWYLQHEQTDRLQKIFTARQTGSQAPYVATSGDQGQEKIQARVVLLCASNGSDSNVNAVMIQIQRVL